MQAAFDALNVQTMQVALLGEVGTPEEFDECVCLLAVHGWFFVR